MNISGVNKVLLVKTISFWPGYKIFRVESIHDSPSVDLWNIEMYVFFLRFTLHFVDERFWIDELRIWIQNLKNQHGDKNKKSDLIHVKIGTGTLAA